MAITPTDALKTAVEPIPLGPLFDPQSGRLTLTGTGFFDFNRMQAGEILSGVNRNRANIVQLETDYTAADGAISSAYISADAVVAADAEGARAALSTTLTTAYEAADATIQADVNTRATISYVDSVESNINGSIAGQYTTITAEYTAVTSTKARTFSQTTAPTATATGDLWIDTDDNNKLYRWSGSAWVAMPDARIATNAASITTEQSARASADTAIATDVTNLTATVTTIGSDLDTAEAAIVTNAASITTEESARASGDSANASSVTTLEASVETNRDDFDAVAWDDVAEVWNWAIASLDGWTVHNSTAAYPSAGGIELTHSTSNFYIRSPVISVSGARFYKIVIDAECVTAGTGSDNGNYLRLYYQTGSHGESASYYDSPRDATTFTAGERRLLVYDMEAPSAGGTDWISNTITRIRWDGSAKTGAVWVVHSVKIVGIGTQRTVAQVKNIAEAYATDSSATARLVWTVNTSTNAATIEQTAAEGYTDGTWNGSAISLTADEITLDGDVVITGTLTTEKLAANAVTNTQVSQTAAAVSASNATWTTAASFSFTSVGIGVELRGTMSLYSQKSFTGGSLGDLEWRLLRGATVLKSAALKVSTVEDSGSGIMYKAADVVADYNDIPSSGTYTYYLQFKITSTDGGVPELTARQASNRFLSAREFKR